LSRRDACQRLLVAAQKIGALKYFTREQNLQSK
jgi:hypothetical protein